MPSAGVFLEVQSLGRVGLSDVLWGDQQAVRGEWEAKALTMCKPVLAVMAF